MSDQASGDEPVIAQLAEVWSSIADACGGLGADQWALDTGCPGWTVKDQVSHLVGTERMLLGDPSPQPIAEVPPHVRNTIGELNEPWIVARRATSGADVLAEFMATVDRRLHALAALSAADFDRVGWSPIGQVPYRDFMTTRVLDCWTHEQDIRSAVDRPGGRDGAGETVVLDRCAAAMPFVVGKKVGPPDGTTVLFVVTGPLGRRVGVAVAGGRAAPTDDFGDPAVTLTMNEETFWRLGFGRVAAHDALAAGGVVIEGDQSMGRRVVDSMAFMI